jgi:hypothetical protein
MGNLINIEEIIVRFDDMRMCAFVGRARALGNDRQVLWCSAVRVLQQKLGVLYTYRETY